MKRLYYLFFYIILTSGASDLLHAQSISKPLLWLRADIDTTSNSIWKDVSGNRHHAMGLSLKVDTTGFNYNPSKRFDGEGFLLSSAGIQSNAENTIFIIYEPKDSTEMMLLRTSDVLTRQMIMTTHRAIGPDSLVDNYELNKSESSILNVLAQKWEEVDYVIESGQMTIGGSEDYPIGKPFKGNIAEIIVFDKSLPFLERAQYETYLAIKYGITLSGKNYVSSNQRLIHKNDDDSGFNSRVFGLGRDDFFLLNQKQSTSVDDSVLQAVIAFDSVLTSNQANKSTMENGTYLLFSDNNGKLEWKKNDKDSTLLVTDRKWMVNTIQPSILPSTYFQIDLTVLPKSDYGYWLAVDPTGSDNFNVDNLKYYELDTIHADSTAIFYDVAWDKDISGKDNFAFAQIPELFVVVNTNYQPFCSEPNAGVLEIEVLKGDAPYTLEWGLEGITPETYRLNEEPLLLENVSVGTYRLTLTDAKGRKLSRNFKLNARDGINVDLGPDLELKTGEEIVLDANNAIPDSVEVEFYWEGSKGLRSTQPKVTIYETGVYILEVTDLNNGCVSSDRLIVKGSVVKEVKVFPNPVTKNELFTLGVSLVDVDGIEIQIYDILGNIFYNYRGSGSSEYQVKASLPHSGQYLININTPGGKDTKRIIVY